MTCEFAESAIPYAGEQRVAEAVWFGLDALAAGKETLDPAVRAAARDSVPLRRAAAAYLLGRRGTKEDQEQAKKLFADPVETVRLRAAQGLLPRRERGAVPVLIHLLERSAVEEAWQAEELLHWLAGDAAPAETIGAGGSEARKACRKGWEAWLRMQGSRIDMDCPHREHRRPGLILIHERDSVADPVEGCLWLCGCDGRARWRLSGLEELMDASWLPGGRLLLAERSESRFGVFAPNYRLGSAGGVTERDLRGKILWKYEGLEYPYSCARLDDGTTFVGGMIGLVEVTLDGKQVFSHKLPTFIVGFTRGRPNPQRLESGRYLIQLTPKKGVLRLAVIDKHSGFVKQSIRLKDRVETNALQWQVEHLANGNWLVAGTSDEIIRIIDPAGATVWRASIFDSMHARQLPSGNILSTSYGRVVELGCDGRVVWEAIHLRDPIWRAWPILNLVRLGFDAPRRPHMHLDISLAYHLKGLRSSNPIVRQHHASFLGRMGANPEAAALALMHLADDPDADVRRVAEVGLLSVRTLASLELLVRGVHDGRVNVREAACGVLGTFDGSCREAAVGLLHGLRDKDARVRRAAATALGSFAELADVVVPALAAALEDKDPGENGGAWSVAHRAAMSLARFAVKAKPAIPALRKAAKAGRLCLRLQVIAMFGQFPFITPEITKTLKDALRDTRPAIRKQAKESLLRHGLHGND
jgi:HEAT repeat protein